MSAAGDARIQALAEELWTTARAQGQCARRVDADAEAAEVRARVRRLAAGEGIRIRTARLGRDVVVARLDAEVWTDDAATMRRKLAAPPE